MAVEVIFTGGDLEITARGALDFLAHWSGGVLEFELIFTVGNLGISALGVLH